LSDFDHRDCARQIADSDFNDPANLIAFYQSVELTIGFGMRKVREPSVAKPIGGCHGQSPVEGGDGLRWGAVLRGGRTTRFDVEFASPGSGRVLIVIGNHPVKNVPNLIGLGVARWDAALG
jgi:hypothetical protein